ncbi:hypothetical protein GJR88_03089 [Dietzia sp. DQ12-45-1b]|nr:hypothetical protein GJR88_03089 [Dietzia sp. DQ12-45-1b]
MLTVDVGRDPLTGTTIPIGHAPFGRSPRDRLADCSPLAG